MAALIGENLTQSRLKECLSYDPKTGLFTWLVPRSGHEAGRTIYPSALHKYVVIKIFGQSYQAHRLAWFYATGEWPKDQIDHKNLIQSDNSWGNLREATSAQNSANVAPLKSKSGLKNVCWRKSDNKYIARLQVGRKRHTVGFFDCPAAAYFAVVIFADIHLGEFARMS